MAGKGRRTDEAAKGLPWHARGQSTVEYLLVLLAFLSMVIAIAGVWKAGRDGLLLRSAVAASSHQMGGGDALGSAQDLALF